MPANNVVAITFLKTYQVVSLYDFPGAGRLLGGYEALDKCGFPPAQANKLVARGTAKLTPGTTPSLTFLSDGGGHVAGDVAAIDADLATPLIAAGTAVLTVP